ncbi:hypothetical protein [Imperialibacter roseus]|uniref:Uncharacterized protein n=1 Tax=Imperialibacter roseus TaxID=1324217 RepID=A0ABZ0IXF7_9BACT|nr:hypothetical protein [Imperialibacter roseus]WOK09481.1 hypothetical protein RT717_12605 [Imperialibacter roseus]|tara:strand:+ start:24721 stop:24930 length:210 start_codon:yes stop_codon:yes gene_type:complete
MSRHEDFERKINRSLNTMEAKISYLHEGMRGLQDSFKEFHEDITEYMAFSAEKYADHEKRLAALEKKVQ